MSRRPREARHGAAGPRRSGAFLLALWLLGCGEPRPELEPLPGLDLSRADATVQQQLQDAEAELQPLLDDSESAPAELAEAYGDLGLLYLTYEFLDASAVCFRNAERLQENDHRWPYLLGYLHQMRGDLDDSVARLERAQALAPEDLPTRLRLAQSHFERGELADAEALWGNALQEKPDSAAALEGLGRIADQNGDSEAARDYLERALAAAPGANSLHYALSQVYRKLGDLEAAERHLRQRGDIQVQVQDPLTAKVLELAKSSQFYLAQAGQAMENERYDLAASAYRQALDIEPSNLTAHRGLAFSLRELGDLESAKSQLDRALEVGTTGDSEKDVWARADLYRLKGELQVLEGDDPAAIDSFRRMVEVLPARLDGHQLLANALARQGNLREAIEHYDRILEAQPESVPTLVRRATAAANLGLEDAASGDFRRALALEPENAEARQSYAAALEHFGRRSQAAEQRRQLAGQLENKDARAAVLQREATELTRSGRYDEALDRLAKARSIDPNDPELLYQQAALLGHLERYEEAARGFTQLLEITPRHPGAHRGLITSLLLQERYGEARERLRQSLEVFPRDAVLAHTLARLLAAAPQPKDRNGELALQLGERLLALAPSNEVRQTMAMALAESGRVGEARSLQRQQIGDLSGPARQRAEERLAVFEQGSPWRLRSPVEVVEILQSGV